MKILPAPLRHSPLPHTGYPGPPRALEQRAGFTIVITVIKAWMNFREEVTGGQYWNALVDTALASG